MIVCDHQAVVVDPAFGSLSGVESLLAEHKAELIAIWITHSHLDHTAGCSDLLQRHPVPLLIHYADAENLTHPGSDGLPAWSGFIPVQPTGFLKNGQELCVGSSRWTVIHTPGHSPGSLCFYNAAANLLLTGDTLFRGTMGAISFPQSCPEMMGESLLRLAALPLETKVYPGHGPTTTIGKERNWMIRETNCGK